MEQESILKNMKDPTKTITKSKKKSKSSKNNKIALHVHELAHFVGLDFELEALRELSARIENEQEFDVLFRQGCSSPLSGKMRNSSDLDLPVLYFKKFIKQVQPCFFPSGSR